MQRVAVVPAPDRVRAATVVAARPGALTTALVTALITLLASGLTAGALPGSADAAPGAGRPVSCHLDTARVRHLVVFAPGTSREAAGAAIDGACGAITGYYPEIAVAVASSADGQFDDRMGRERAYSAQAEALGTPAPGAPRRAVGVQSLDRAPSGPTTPVPTADRTAEQWDMAMIDADRAHAIRRGSPDVLVGVLDSGIDPNHPELAAALDRDASAGCVTGVPDTRQQAWQASGEHGTHVAGIIAAADDGVGITGVAPGVRIASVKVVGPGGFIYPEAAVCGFMWAAHRHMRLTNNSYFVDPWLFTCRDEPGQSVVYEALRRAAGYATDQGVLAVAAAGNENLDLADQRVDASSPNNAARTTRPIDRSCGMLPAALPDVLTVSAVGAAGVKASYSSYGAGVVDVTAPGGDLRQRSASATSGCVLATVPGGYGRLCGTSMAAPHAVGVAALAASAHPDAGPAELTRLVEASATPLACPAGRYDPDSNGTADAVCTAGETGTGFYGAGLVNAEAAAT